MRIIIMTINTWGKIESKVLDNTGSGYYQTTDIKEKITKEYLTRTKKLPETELSTRKTIQGMYTWVVLLIRNLRPFLKFTREEL